MNKKNPFSWSSSPTQNETYPKNLAYMSQNIVHLICGLEKFSFRRKKFRKKSFSEKI